MSGAGHDHGVHMGEQTQDLAALVVKLCHSHSVPCTVCASDCTRDK